MKGRCLRTAALCFGFPEIVGRWREPIQDHKGCSRSHDNTDITTQRAYIGRRSVESVQWQQYVANDGRRIDRMEITCIWENNGATPAINVTFCAIQPIVCPDDIPDDFEPSKIETGPLPKIGIGSRQTMAGGSVAIPIADLIRCSRRECRIFAVFRLEYNDVFLDTPVRVTQYCEEVRFTGIDPVTDRPIPPGTTWPFAMFGHPRFQIFS